MNALGSLGSYISKGVCSVSGQFQPFGGAVDIIVVEHSDGSFRSSPWYVRFGKFQGVLKAKEKTVKIGVNGAEANFYMHLNNKGQAFFLKEVLPEGEEADKGDQSADDCAFFDGRRPVKSSSYTSPSPDVTNVPRSNSDQTQMIGLQRLNSLEFAEIAAQLLEVNWATALPTGSPKRDVTTFCNGKRGSRVDNLEDDVLRCRIRDSALEEKCEVIAKMGEDTFKEELNSKAKDHETGHYNRSGTGERDRPGLISESFDESILRPINGEMNQNGDVGNPNHRLCQSLDMKSRPSKPPSVFARSLGGRERQLMGRQNFREGFESSKIFPADTDGKVAVKVNGTRTESDSDLKRTVTDNSMKIFSPTSEQLASLKLNEGGNVVTFTFCTKMLGKQQVDARIYLWKWNDRIIISDVDGTITKSDVLGQCMPLVGIDWTQEGVARLYSAIKQNGYRVMFLSARSISQAYITRQFLLNLKQDGEALPDGPVVISPDGIFPSLYREVIRRVPHEFKIACLEDIKALFPPDSNPFYAGFGNRDTDEISYLRVGIPRGKIFIINPKGEVVVNRHVQRRSYISIHSLVDGMFPATTSPEQEDFNSWNYWKLPTPAIEF